MTKEYLPSILSQCIAFLATITASLFPSADVAWLHAMQALMQGQSMREAGLSYLMGSGVFFIEKNNCPIT